MTQIWTAENGSLVRLGYGESDFVMDTTRPVASNTGLNVDGLSVGDLTLYDGNMTISTSGTTVENMLIRGQVKINNVSNVTIRNCKIVGRPLATEFCSAMIETVGTNVLIENCELSCYDDTQTPALDNSKSTDGHIISAAINALSTGTTTVRRCDVHDTVDGITFYGGNVGEVAGNYIHDLNFRTDDSSKASSTPAYWSHNDGIQIGAGVGHYFHGNNIDMRYSQVTGMGSTLTGTMQNCHGMLLQSNTAVVTGLRVEYNWLAYGDICMLWSSPPPNLSGGQGSMLGNRFTPNQDIEFSFYKQMQNNPNSAWTITGTETTVYSDDPDTPADWRGQPIKAPYMAAGNTQTTWAFNKDAHTP